MSNMIKVRGILVTQYTLRTRRFVWYKTQKVGSSYVSSNISRSIFEASADQHKRGAIIWSLENRGMAVDPRSRSAGMLEKLNVG